MGFAVDSGWGTHAIRAGSIYDFKRPLYASTNLSVCSSSIGCQDMLSDCKNAPLLGTVANPANTTTQRLALDNWR